VPDRTDLVEITHNTWVKPSSVDVIRFMPAPLISKDLPPCPDGMRLEAWCGQVCIEVVWFDGSNTKAWNAARNRMAELVQRVNAANRATE
jgi:hypothetical protein